MDEVEPKEIERIEKKIVELLQNRMLLICTLASDKEKESVRHQDIAVKFNIDFYFALYFYNWQRSANEILNGLIWQYFYKKRNIGPMTKH